MRCSPWPPRSRGTPPRSPGTPRPPWSPPVATAWPRPRPWPSGPPPAPIWPAAAPWTPPTGSGRSSDPAPGVVTSPSGCSPCPASSRPRCSPGIRRTPGGSSWTSPGGRPSALIRTRRPSSRAAVPCSPRTTAKPTASTCGRLPCTTSRAATSSVPAPSSCTAGGCGGAAGCGRPVAGSEPPWSPSSAAAPGPGPTRRAANCAPTGPRPRRSLAAGLSRLTPQQLRIARHVAEGATNREVAQRLAVSTRTVDYHLRNVFAALGVRSRVELARMVDQEHR
ncbi:LuxR C-terminal-related transcriptional regulator [Streptomyces hawaiiensis]|uniref:helix-turn-helix domain-containing protein n=1 Tax=Streptomyces hawaiiensis TaxID=67305 RepID=UPI0036608B72